MPTTTPTPPTTLNRMIDESCQRFAPLPALSMPMEKPLSYGELHEKIIQTSGLLQGFAVRAGDRVAILADNSPEWIIVYFAVVRLGGVVVPMLPDFLAPDIHHILRETEAKLLFISARQLPKVEEFQGNTLKRIIALDPPASTDQAVPSLAGLLAQTPRFSLKILTQVRKAADRIKASDAAAIIYTSGTSGHSKAVILSHGNLAANAAATSHLAAIDAGWTFLSLLPLAHAYAFTVNCLVPLGHGSRIVFAGKPPTPTMLERICKAEKPAVVCLVPLIIEKIYKKRILPRLENNPFLKAASKLPGLNTVVYRQMGKRLLRVLGGDIRL
ncbi:MAG: long-chain fatty acid--CoA ligase, partial [Desulfobulbaceae bacterium]|nr:long-chain fatty acid--CoA ligase [Desulfobulbaceae bacterium]